ncbi:glycoside hydrolase family 36 N-terminal domain-containing protein [Streptomyces sp. L7]
MLSGPTSSYAVHLTERDELLHLHWGPRIALADAEELAARPLPGGASFEAPLDGHEEYPVEGGPRFVRPALSVRTPERRGTEWTFDRYDTDGDELRLRFRDAGLTITLHYRTRGDVVERWTVLDNEGTEPLELLRGDSATWTLPDREEWQLLARPRTLGRRVTAGAFPLTYGEKIIGSRRGHTGHQYLPWVALDTDATEERGEVYGCALGWSGSWRIAVAQLPDAPRADHRRRRVRRVRAAEPRRRGVLHHAPLRRPVERRRLRRRQPHLARLPADVRHPGRRP